MIVFPIAASGQRLVLTSPVLEHFKKFRQLRFWQREAGGQLFARLSLPDILIEEASGPRPSDWRSRYSYRPDREAEQREITSRHARGLHFVGDWHTHPEDIPSPSGEDISNMHDLVRRSAHSLNGFVLVIVGRHVFPKGLHVGLYGSSTEIVQLRTATSSLCEKHKARLHRTSV